MKATLTAWGVLVPLLGLAGATTALAGSFRANELVAEQNGGWFHCAGGEAHFFHHGGFAVTPLGHDDSYIDSRTGSALVGGRAGERVAALKDDADLCAGPVDCADEEGISDAIAACW